MKSIRNMKAREFVLIVLLAICFVFGGLHFSSQIKEAKFDPQVLMAAVTNPSPASPGYIMCNLPIIATLTTGTINNIVRFKMPWPATLLGVSGIYRAAVGGNQWTVDVLENGVTVLSTPLVINSSTVAEGVISDSAIADEATISIKLVGNTNSIYDPSIQLLFKRK